ncbi:desulforedoxin [Methanobacterium alkalithermotolerans]|uniref:Desulforedoxin n=1 Tax=Methanobacterium alkalithermotolerans TaxID=2731220 RepID=A0A8T8K9J6_9EURY|nr:desulforedoxin [Methanobacterium alkalithermotolerans]
MMVAKKGEKYRCEVCGLTINVEEECGCDECAIVCCGKPMEKKE